MSILYDIFTCVKKSPDEYLQCVIPNGVAIQYRFFWPTFTHMFYIVLTSDYFWQHVYGVVPLGTSNVWESGQITNTPAAVDLASSLVCSLKIYECHSDQYIHFFLEEPRLNAHSYICCVTLSLNLVALHHFLLWTGVNIFQITPHQFGR